MFVLVWEVDKRVDDSLVKSAITGVVHASKDKLDEFIFAVVIIELSSSFAELTKRHSPPGEIVIIDAATVHDENLEVLDSDGIVGFRITSGIVYTLLLPRLCHKSFQKNVSFESEKLEE